jgi:ribosomal protein L35AE/L33A
VDTQCRVTIIDDDEPGILSFVDRAIKVRAKDGKAYIKVLRQHGSDGIVKCKFETKADDSAE